MDEETYTQLVYRMVGFCDTTKTIREALEKRGVEGDTQLALQTLKDGGKIVFLKSDFMADGKRINFWRIKYSNAVRAAGVDFLVAEARKVDATKMLVGDDAECVRMWNLDIALECKP